jgi:hypothetical protein
MENQDPQLSARPLSSFSYTGAAGPNRQSDYRPWNPLLLVLLAVFVPFVGLFVVAWNWRRYGRSDYFEKMTFTSAGLLLLIGCLVFTLPGFASPMWRNLGDVGFAVPYIFISYLLIVLLGAALSLQIRAWMRVREDASGLETLAAYRYPWKTHLVVAGIITAIPYLLLTTELNTALGDHPVVQAQRTSEAVRTQVSMDMTQRPSLSQRYGGFIAQANADRLLIGLVQGNQELRRLPVEEGSCDPGVTCAIVLRSADEPDITFNIGWRLLEENEGRDEALAARAEAVASDPGATVLLDTGNYDNRQFAGGAYGTGQNNQRLVLYAYTATEIHLITVELVWPDAFRMPVDAGDERLITQASRRLNQVLWTIHVDSD